MITEMVFLKTSSIGFSLTLLYYLKRWNYNYVS